MESPYETDRLLFEAAQTLVRQWPQNKEVPRLLRDLYDKNRGPNDWLIGQCTEALSAAAESEEDLTLIDVWWGDDDEE